jgi:hypothetical protein
METKLSLYEITNEQRELISQIEALDGELSPEMEEALAINQSQLAQKSIAYLEVIRTKEAFNGLIDNEIKRLQGLKKRNNNVVDRLNDNLLMAVKTFGEFEVGTNKFGTRKSTSVEIEDEDALPKEYISTVITTKPDKAKIGEDLKAGLEVKGAKLSFNQNLKIN